MGLMQLALLSDPGEWHPHTGRPVVRARPGGGVTVLCAYGHLIWSIRPGEWAGSTYQARLADPNYQVTCEGPLPVEVWWQSQCGR
ncbi:hypothetical protein [Planotetraspora sp. GP83]|uniref:hypothetical protein n=1 Tax=Planotetraspora sp. GP83 TaxID=3156264 RepID=UPI003518C0F9